MKLKTYADQIDELLKTAEAIAVAEYDGHLTILRFTTNWKACFGTPSGDSLNRSVDDETVQRLPAFNTLEGALRHLLAHKPACSLFRDAKDLGK